MRSNTVEREVANTSGTFSKNKTQYGTKFISRDSKTTP